MKRLLTIIGALSAAVGSAFLLAATSPYAPIPMASYGYNGSAWVADTTTATTPTLPGPPQMKPIARYCYNSGSSTWAPCAPVTNAIGCLDGYDHLPCTVYAGTLTSESAGTAAYATEYTTAAAGVYRVNAYLYSTVCGTSSAGNMTASYFSRAVETGITAQSGATVATWQVGSSTTSCSSGSNFSVIYNLAISIPIQTETLLSISSSGTQSAAATWARALQIERLK